MRKGSTVEGAGTSSSSESTEKETAAQEAPASQEAEAETSEKTSEDQQTTESQPAQEASAQEAPAQEEQPAQEAPAAAPALTYGSTFEFDDFTIQIGGGATATIFDNQFSEYNGSTVIALPVTLTNNKSEPSQLNMFYLKEFGSAGTELNSIFTYFDDIRMAGEMRPGASMNGNLYFLYDGNGTYYLSFQKPWQKAIEVELPIAL